LKSDKVQDSKTKSIYDAHCHLESLKEKSESRILAVAATELKEAHALSQYRQSNPQAKIGIGIHPWYISPNSTLTSITEKLEAAILEYRPDFIGETGLDKLKPEFDLQQEIFYIHLKLAQKYNLPLVIHCVRAYNELLAILSKFTILRGMVHAYNANSETAKQLAKKNMLLGVGSIILNENSQLSKSIERIPLEQLLIESDAPYMPYGTKEFSTSEDCMLYAKQLAENKKTNLTEIISKVNQNFITLFNSAVTRQTQTFN
jgi:TatD DNase family protein